MSDTNIHENYTIKIAQAIMIVDDADSDDDSVYLHHFICNNAPQSLPRSTQIYSKYSHTHSHTAGKGNWTQHFSYRKLRTYNWIMMNRTNLKCKHLIHLKVACNLFPIELLWYFRHNSLLYSSTPRYTRNWVSLNFRLQTKKKLNKNSTRIMDL